MSLDGPRDPVTLLPPDVAIDLLLLKDQAVRSGRTRPLGEPDAAPLGNTAHVHYCPHCRREYTHSERACVAGYERVAVGCLPVSAARAEGR